MWDWYTWLNTKHDIDITPSCPLQDTYLTGSGKYCDTNNMNIMGIAVGDAVTQVAEGELAKLANFCKILQNFGGLVLGCIKTKFCKKIRV